MDSIIDCIEEKLAEGYELSFNEVLCLIENDKFKEKIFFIADNIRKKNFGNYVDLCSIMNVKSGRCSENCKFCAQSSFYKTNAQVYGLKSCEDVLKEAIYMEKWGVHRFSLVTSGERLSDDDFNSVIEIIRVLRRKTKMSICASLGSLSYERAKLLKEAGLSRYHHNIETCSEFYTYICDTHTFIERIKTIENAKKADLEICCGGIIGMGESMEQRLKLAFEIRNLGVNSVPINILNPIKGTPLENMRILKTEEILFSIAVFRIILPNVSIRVAGGRSALGDNQYEILKVGLSGLMVGNYLTTPGRSIDDDLKMIRSAELDF